jgi:hypothetical protein
MNILPTTGHARELSENFYLESWPLFFDNDPVPVVADTAHFEEGVAVLRRLEPDKTGFTLTREATRGGYNGYFLFRTTELGDTFDISEENHLIDMSFDKEEAGIRCVGYHTYHWSAEFVSHRDYMMQHTVDMIESVWGDVPMPENPFEAEARKAWAEQEEQDRVAEIEDLVDKLSLKGKQMVYGLIREMLKEAV